MHTCETSKLPTIGREEMYVLVEGVMQKCATRPDTVLYVLHSRVQVVFCVVFVVGALVQSCVETGRRGTGPGLRWREVFCDVEGC